MNTEDRLDILQKIAEYSYTFDGNDTEGWVNILTEDGVWDCIIEGKEEPVAHLDGRDALREFAEDNRKNKPDTIRSFHHQSGTFFEDQTPETARTRTMVIITVHDLSRIEAAKPAHILNTGVYYDDWVKTPDGWRIKKRLLVM